MTGTPYILYVPDIALEKIFSFLSYDEIAKNRIVCKKFNDVGSKFLTRGFFQLEKRHAAIYKKVKSQLPRRESERRAHPLSRHSDILQAVETRISMLNMTYHKFIGNNLLCFIPGKVLDEMKTVLDLVESDQTPPRTHQLLQELRDLSSMAMEHFDEHILPRVKEQVDRKTALSYGCPPSSSKTPRLIYAHNSLSNEIHKVKKQSKTHKYHISFLTLSTQKLFQKLRKQNIRIKAQSLKIREQEKKIQEQQTKIQEQEATLADFKKHIDEWNQKYKDLTTEFVRAIETFVPTSPPRSTPAAPPSPSPPRLHKTNIKPRKTHILPKSYSGLNFDVERKRKSNLSHDLPLKRNKAEDEGGESGNLRIELPSFSGDSEKADRVASEKGSSKVVYGCSKSVFSNTDFGQIIENWVINPLTNIKTRKRKMHEDIDLK
ncbi:F-box only protein 28 [Diabrotica virgifera virgifera]|uniref:F-box domain-containing protein n=1 Tax=Diabrotica virgifera virgifera TaxID=50390 RepID=A0ABM5KVQ8_DIAVI|nr:F-box only protein 28 [Diabrotica virgifera virgifera]